MGQVQWDLVFALTWHLVFTQGKERSRADLDPRAFPQAQLQHLALGRRPSYLTLGRQELGGSDPSRRNLATAAAFLGRGGQGVR